MSSRTLTIARIAFVATVALVAAACGGDDNGGGGEGGSGGGSGGSSGGEATVSAEAQPYVDALKSSLREDTDDDFELSEAQIDCVAPRWVAAIGVDRLKEHDVTPAELADDSDMDFSNLGLTEEDGGAMYDAFGECDVNIHEIMMAEFAQDDELSDTARACMESVFTEENLRLMMVTSLVKGDDAVEDDPALAPMMGQLMGCAFMSMDDMDFGDMDTDGVDGLDDQAGN